MSLNAFFNNAPESADIPPTKPPIIAVMSNSNIQFPPSGNKTATFLANRLSLGIVLNKAKTDQATNTAAKPDKRDFPDDFPIKNAAKKQITATIHQGKNKLPIIDRIKMIRNSIKSMIPEIGLHNKGKENALVVCFSFLVLFPFTKPLILPETYIATLLVFETR